jgi:hypothetical protein
VTQYAQRNLTASTKCVPGTSQTFRLPIMNPGEFHIMASDFSAPSSSAETLSRAAPGVRTPAVAGVAGHDNQININPVGPDLPVNPIGPTLPVNPNLPIVLTGPIVPGPYPVSLDIFHGDQLVASGAPPPIQQCQAFSDDTWRVRVNYAAQSQATDTIRFDLMPYTSTLPVLTRRIPLDFLQQGFDNNWNGRKYISLAFENSTLIVRFDPEIASYYNLTNTDYTIAGIPTEINPPNLMVKDIQFKMDSSSGGFQELSGPLPYIQVTVTFGGIDGQPITGSILHTPFTVGAFSIS